MARLGDLDQTVDEAGPAAVKESRAYPLTGARGGEELGLDVLGAHGVTLGGRLLGFEHGHAVLARDLHSGDELRIEDVDTVVLSLGMESDDALHRALAGRVPELHRVGSAYAPRWLADATQHGASLGRLL